MANTSDKRLDDLENRIRPGQVIRLQVVYWDETTRQEWAVGTRIWDYSTQPPTDTWEPNPDVDLDAINAEIESNLSSRETG